jgi:hypothetical protein
MTFSPATGGTPKRLTYHPAADHAIAWMPDGKQVLFAAMSTFQQRLSSESCWSPI